jgi:hypothetical protein
MHFTIKIISKGEKYVFIYIYIYICQRMINFCLDISLELNVQIEVQNEGRNRILEQRIFFCLSCWLPPCRYFRYLGKYTCLAFTGWLMVEEG